MKQALTKLTDSVKNLKEASLLEIIDCLAAEKANCSDVVETLITCYFNYISKSGAVPKIAERMLNIAIKKVKDAPEKIEKTAITPWFMNKCYHVNKSKIISEKERKFLQLLLKNKKGLVDATDDNGWTSLYYAVDAGDLKTVELLIGFGASCNRRNETTEKTALDHAKSQLAGFEGMIRDEQGNKEGEVYQYASKMVVRYKDIVPVVEQAAKKQKTAR